MSWHHISVYLLDGICIFSLILFTIVFWAYKSNFIKIQKAKEKFNQLQIFNYNSKYKHIKILSKHNEKIARVYESIISDSTVFASSLEIVRTKLMTITAVNSEFRYFETLSMLKDIQKDLANIEELKNKLSSTNKYTNDYLVDLTNILVSIRSNFEAIVEFYQYNLESKYGNKTFSDMIFAIKSKVLEINDMLYKIKKDSFVSLGTEICIFINKLYSMTYQLYIYDRVYSYIAYIKSKIEETEDIRLENFSESEKIQAEQYIVNGYKALDEMYYQMKQADLKKIVEPMLTAYKYLNDVYTKIELNEKYKNIINNDVIQIKNHLQNLNINSKILFDSFTNIEDDFGNRDKTVTDRVKKLRGEIKSIVFAYNGLEEMLKDLSVNKDVVIERINTISASLLEWKKEILNLIWEIRNKYNNFLSINNKVAQDKLIISQLMLIKQKYNGDDDDSQSIFKNIKLRVEQIDQKLLSNYQANYAICKKEIEDLDNEIKKIIDNINLDFTANTILERLMFFTNKYRYEGEGIEKEVELVENMIKNGSSNKAIDELIFILDKVKYSAQSSNIEFK